MNGVAQLLDELLAVTGALERTLARPDREPDLELLRTRAVLVDRLRERLEASGRGHPGADAAAAAHKLRDADRRLRRVVAIRMQALGQDIADLSRQRIALRAYFAGGQGRPYR